jgi:hypothetical protein
MLRAGDMAILPYLPKSAPDSQCSTLSRNYAFRGAAKHPGAGDARR